MDVVEIPLTKGYTAIVDFVDKDLVNWGWQVFSRSSTRTIYAKRRDKNSLETIYMHRVILERIVGRQLSRYEYCDHINGLGYDNRRCNLRLVTPAQNTQNRRYSSNAKLLGATEYRKGKWVARIQVDGKNVHLGVFNNSLDAHKAYCCAAIKYRGALVNFGPNSPFTPADFMDQSQQAA